MRKFPRPHFNYYDVIWQAFSVGNGTQEPRSLSKIVGICGCFKPPVGAGKNSGRGPRGFDIAEVSKWFRTLYLFANILLKEVPPWASTP